MDGGGGIVRNLCLFKARVLEYCEIIMPQLSVWKAARQILIYFDDVLCVLPTA